MLAKAHGSVAFKKHLPCFQVVAITMAGSQSRSVSLLVDRLFMQRRGAKLRCWFLLQNGEGPGANDYLQLAHRIRVKIPKDSTRPTTIPSNSFSILKIDRRMTDQSHFLASCHTLLHTGLFNAPNRNAISETD